MLSTYGANWLLSILTAQDYLPGSLSLALLTQLPDPGDDGTDIVAYEPDDGGYLRQGVALIASHWTVPTAGSVSYIPSYLTYTPVSDWPPLKAYALVTADVDGFVVLYDYLPTTYTFRAGATVAIPTNALTIKAP